MSLRSLGQKVIRTSFVKSIVRCGSGHHSPSMPPFAQLRPPAVQLPEEVELVWDDSVAPETCIDFDASHISSAEVFGTFSAAIAMLVGLYSYIVYYDPSESNPVAPRSTVIPPNTVDMFFGVDVPDAAADDEEETEEEDDE